ncbi:MAG: SOS response-associated peptidase, partial [Planctomycetota bacterium]
MCGRFTLATPTRQFAQAFLPDWSVEDAEQRATELKYAKRYNIAPTEQIDVVRRLSPDEDGLPDGAPPSRTWDRMHWGLIPEGSTSRASANAMINARGETVHEKRSFAAAFAWRRCVIPMGGYYEWRRVEGSRQKQPYWISAAGGGTLAAAGIWEINRHLQSKTMYSCSLITTSANQTTKRIHDRMPVFLAMNQLDEWMNPN